MRSAGVKVIEIGHLGHILSVKWSVEVKGQQGSYRKETHERKTQWVVQCLCYVRITVPVQYNYTARRRDYEPNTVDCDILYYFAVI